MTGTQSLYFYLSHAHDDAEALDDLDHWVEAFYRDLVTAVRQRSPNRLSSSIGAFRSCVIDHGDRVERSTVVAAQAFVPLYSPAYLRDGRAMAERSAFMVSDRLAGRGRIVPVLWQPTLGGSPAPELDEAAAVSPIVEYNVHGLFELSRLQQHEEAYRRVVAFLADRIVEVADGLNGRRMQPPHKPAAPGVPPVQPRARFVLTLVTNDESSLVFPLAERIASDLERSGYYDVLTVRYPREGDASAAGLFLIDAAVLADMPAHLRERILDLPDSRLAVAVGLRAGALRLEGPLRTRVHALAGGNSRLQIRASSEPIAGIAKEILGLIRRHSTGRIQARPYPPRTKLHD